MEESGSAFPRDVEGGEEHRKGVKGKKKKRVWKRYKRKDYSKASHESRE